MAKYVIYKDMNMIDVIEQVTDTIGDITDNINFVLIDNELDIRRLSSELLYIDDVTLYYIEGNLNRHSFNMLCKSIYIDKLVRIGPYGSNVSRF